MSFHRLPFSCLSHQWCWPAGCGSTPSKLRIKSNIPVSGTQRPSCAMLLPTLQGPIILVLIRVPCNFKALAKHGAEDLLHAVQTRRECCSHQLIYKVPTSRLAQINLGCLSRSLTVFPRMECGLVFTRSLSRVLLPTIASHLSQWRYDRGSSTTC
jgi:hypothetical protein